MMLKMDAQKGAGGGYSGYSQVTYSGSGKSYTISGYSGKKILVVVFTFASSAVQYDVLDTVTCDAAQGTMTKMENLTTSNQVVAGTIFEIDVKSNTLVLTYSGAYNYLINPYIAE